MVAANRYAGRPLRGRAAVGAAALCLLAGLFALAGCSAGAAVSEEGAAGAANPPLMQVVDGSVDFPHRATVGRVSLGYPDSLWVMAELDPSSSNALGKDVVTTAVQVGDDDFSHGFLVGECEGLSLDDVLAYAATAQEQAPARAGLLEEKARESETSDQMFSGMARHFRNVVYSDPERIMLNGRRGVIWEIVMPYEGDAFVTRLSAVEVDRDAIGFALCGFYQHEYDADPAFWDDILSTLEVR